MSRYATSFVLGYHGCDEEVGRKALAGEVNLLRSERDYDWLGPGVYFWEGDPGRAREWAEEKVARGAYEKPFVLGAVIDLGNCLDLLVRENLDWLKIAYESLAASHEKSGLALPRNKDIKGSTTNDKLLRNLDCAVIRRLHSILEQKDDLPPGTEALAPFDTVRGLFTEGEPVYPDGGFYLKSHTQIAVCNDTCIKGLFLPR
ncbi:Hypothetical protein HVIM_02620 [Roseomonas mucosa]|uniref:DUF3990 domain-containing protein n=2 Tax=Roseomonas TaxID=125216 RepID=A0A379N4Z1_9PROT|nr:MULTISPECIES: hypothetical protein [Roseomonas]APT57297.1 hypothetical protein RGI145_09465 [Roseomonas gilardii]MCG7350247.1 hypothetical protein [Roseomonas mucosa]MCG7356008.1 hypothetical protein [Roseomonas mucosa]MDT8292781.1 hypothetical protein [Roseomonas mucosa]QDD95119.1 Hypothetical protein HVIM_02620 [Roseomonas mucosa]